MRYENIYINFLLIIYYLFVPTLNPTSFYLFLPLSIFGFLLKITLIKIIFDKKKYKIIFKIRFIEVIIYSISLFYIFKDINYLFHSFGLFNILVFFIIYTIGYFLYFEKKVYDNVGNLSK